MDRLAYILRPSPFKIGCLVVLASCLVFYSFGRDKPYLLASLDNQVTSAMFRFRGNVPVTGRVVIIDIDEKSLREVGQWPWPRDIVAKLVTSINDAGPKSIGFDIVFAEKDRTSPSEYAGSLSGLVAREDLKQELASIGKREDLNHDLVLGRAISEAPSVLGYVFQMTDDGLKSDEEKPFPSATIMISPAEISPQELLLLSGYRATLNIPDVGQAPTEGFMNVFPDSSGMVRKVPLFMALDDIPYPSLALEMVRTAAGAREIEIHAARQKAGKRSSILGATVGNLFIPTDDRGHVMVNFLGPYRTFEYIPAVDVLKGSRSDRIAGKHVIIGTSASGLLDFHATPFSGIFPGVEIQATVIDNILSNSLFTYDIFTEIGLTYTVIIAGGVLLSALLAYTGALAGGIAGILFMAGIFAGNYYLFFLKGKLLGLTYPLTTIIVVFLTVTLFNYFFEFRKKQFIHDAFSRYVSPMVVTELMGKPEKLTLSGEERELTILFSDIRNFTSISETLDAHRLGIFMNTYLTAMSDIIMEHHGMVDKYIGDAIVAIWGAPLDDPDHVRNAIRASLRMKEVLEGLRRGWKQQGLPFVDIGIGINTGIVSVGNFGSERRFEYTVLGDNVNLASRLEALNKYYGTNIIVSEFTRNGLMNDFFFRKLDTVRVKGKSRSIIIYEPVSEGMPAPEARNEVSLFEAALESYARQDFVEARNMIWDLKIKNPSRLYDLYLERINGFLVTPPGPDWDGVHTFDTK